jgi:hypothetical protein
MFFLLFGSSASGKTVVLDSLRGRLTRMAIHDFDEVGVPSGADTAWRHRANERWVRRAIGYQGEGLDVLLACQTPLGELLATPSAPRLESISACLLDCDDRTRIDRLRTRGNEWRARAAVDLADSLAWARWMRGHAADPRWHPEVIQLDATSDEMFWSRWSQWRAGDPRWRIHVIDSSHLTMEVVAAALAAWVEEERALFRAGGHPLAGEGLSGGSSR